MSIFIILDKGSNIICNCASKSSIQTFGKIILQRMDNFDTEILEPFLFKKTSQAKDTHYLGIELGRTYFAEEFSIEDGDIIIKKYSLES